MGESRLDWILGESDVTGRGRSVYHSVNRSFSTELGASGERAERNLKRREVKGVSCFFLSFCVPIPTDGERCSRRKAKQSNKFWKDVEGPGFSLVVFWFKFAA